MDVNASIGDATTLRTGKTDSLGRIDQYELVRELGGGGFGTVFLARDTVADVDVAVKGLPPLVRNNKEELENVRKNFQLVSRLHHPHVAAALVLHPAKAVSYSDRAIAGKLRVFEGDALMVMAFAPGVTLSQWRKQFPGGKVPPEKALPIVSQIAEALDYAHGEKIIHRDVKPANVMIETKPDGALVARVLDFGLAAEVRSSMSRVSQQVTDTSGTRPYMAPEQWLGKKQGAATDQYALAALTHELLAGEVPFASAFETGDPVVMMNVVGREAPELSKDVPSSMRKALARALAKDPKDRFPSCGDFVAALEGKGGGFFAGKARAWTLAAGAALLLGAGVWGGLQWHAERQREQQREELRLAEKARQEAERKAAEEKKKQEAERLAAKKAKEEAERKAAEEKKKKEAERLAAEKAKEEAAARLREAEERARQAEERLAEEKRKAEERLAKEREKAAEMAKAEAEARERARLAAEEERERLAAEEERERLAAKKRQSGGLYMVVDLTDNSISYLDAVPSGGWTDEYKTSKLVLRRIEPGTFLMGSPASEKGRFDDEKQHKVTLTKPYYLGVFQVTQSQWECVMGNNPAYFKGPMRPVERVSWTDADGFCGRLRRRVGNSDFCLPTEAQWEYACRAGTTTAYFWGNALNGDKANCDGNYPCGTTAKGPHKRETCAVGSYAPNAWGLYDMHGNVWEWCADWHGTYGGDATDSMGPESGSDRVVRGGGWINHARYCRSAIRDRGSPGFRNINLGFRVALAPSSL